MRPNINIDADDLERVDEYGRSEGIRREEALARLVRTGLEVEGYDE